MDRKFKRKGVSLLLTLAVVAALMLGMTITASAGTGGTTLSAGDVVIVSINGDTDTTDIAHSYGRGFSFMPLVDLAAGTVIYFTDYGWSDTTSAFITNASVADEFIHYTAPAGGVAAGTIIRCDSYNNTDFTFDYTYSGTGTNNYLNTAGLTQGDELLAFQSSSNTAPFSPRTFIFAASIVSKTIVPDGWATGVGANGTDGSGAGSALPTGLTDDVTALSFNQIDTANDNAAYSGPTTAATKAEWQDRIKDYSNWTFNDAAPIPTPLVGPFSVTGASTAPTVTTQAVSGIGAKTATGNGNITSLGVPNPTAYGVCWNTTGTPTTSDSKVNKGTASATGAFTASMTGLSADTKYYVRAYATNTSGTVYGDAVEFTTASLAVGGWIEDNSVIGSLNYDSSLAAYTPAQVNFGGAWYAVWSEDTSGGATQIRVAKRSSVDNTWSLIDGGGTTGINYDSTKAAAEPKLVTYNGNLYAVWMELAVISISTGSGGTYSGRQVRVARYDGGSAWTFVDALDSHNGSALHTTDYYAGASGCIYTDSFSTCADSNGLYVAWAERYSGSTSNSQLHVAKYDGTNWTIIGGTSISSGLNIDTSKEAFDSSVMTDSLGAVYVAWTETTATSYKSVFVKKYAGGTSWTDISGSASGLIYDTSRYGSEVYIAEMDGDIYAAWVETTASSGSQIRVKQYNGTTWSFVDGNAATGLNHDTSQSAYGLSMAADASNLYLAWNEASSTVSQFRVNSYNTSDGWTELDSDGLSTGGDATGIGMDCTDVAGRISLAYGNSQLSAVFTQFDFIDHIGQLYYKRYDAAFSLPSGGDEIDSIGLSAGELTPTFGSAVYNYTILTDKDTTSETITITLKDPNASMIYKGVKYASGAPITVSLEVGDNNLLIYLVSDKAAIVKHIDLRINRAVSSTQRLISASLDAYADDYGFYPGGNTDTHPGENVLWFGYSGGNFSSALLFDYDFPEGNLTAAQLSVKVRDYIDNRASEDPYLNLSGSDNISWTLYTTVSPTVDDVILTGAAITDAAWNSFDVSSYLKGTGAKSATFILTGNNDTVTDDCYASINGVTRGVDVPKLLLTFAAPVNAAITPTTALTEENLDTNNLYVDLTGTAFVDSTLLTSNFTLNNAPSGVTIENVSYIGATGCAIDLAYTGADFDSNVTDFSVTIKAAELSTAANLTSGALTITATVETIPAVTTAAITNIGSTTATAGGSVTASGGEAVTESGVVYAKTTAPTTATGTKVIGTATSGAFTAELSSLDPNTTYYVRAFASNSVGTAYGTETSFTTDAVSAAVTPGTALTEENLDANSLIVSLSGTTFKDTSLDPANFTLNNAPIGVTIESVTYSSTTNCAIDLAYTGADFDSSVTDFSVTIKAAELSTAANLTSSALTITATVETEPTLTTADATAIGAVSATAGGDVTATGGEALTERGVVYSTSLNPTTADSKITSSAITLGAFTVNLTGLTPNTTYHVRAYAINSVGTNYGADKTFKTDAVSAAVTPGTALTEENLDANSLIVSLSGTTFKDTSLDPANFTLNNAPIGVTIESVTYNSTTNCAIDLAYTGADFDGSVTDFSVTIKAAELASGIDLTSETLPITATVETAPSVTTTTISAIGAYSATGSGNVTASGGETVTEAGIVCSTATNPQIGGASVINAVGTTTSGIFTANITGLSPGTKYYVKAYAINSVGTTYGTESDFTTIAQTADPTADPTTGSTVKKNAAIILTSESGAVIYYTTDGTAPTASSASITSGDHISITGEYGTTVTVKAYAEKSGIPDSGIVTFTYTIQAKQALTINGLSASNKEYDGTASAQISGTAALDGTITSGDAITVSHAAITAVFADKSVGNAKAVTASGFYLTGADSQYYTLTQPTGLTANITAKEVTISAVTINEKYYDGTNIATIAAVTLSGVLTGDAVTADSSAASAAFNNANTGIGKTVNIGGTITLVGADANNYSLSAALPTITGNILNAGTVLTPVASTAGGAVASGSGITLSCGTAGATIYFTIDGSTPTSASAVYTTAVAISGPMTIKAIALKEFMNDSGIMSEAYTIAVESSSHHNTDNTATTPPSDGTVTVNNETTSAGTSETGTNSSGQTVTTITVDTTSMDAILEQKGNGATVTIPSTAGSDVTVGVLTGQTVKSMETKDAVLEIKTETASYTLPASEINIDAVSAQIGSAVELKDIKISVSIAEPSADTVRIVEDTANKNSYQLVVKPVEFEITCTSGDKTVSVSRFNAYVERTIEIPAGVDPSKITTGIVLNADGTFRQVPTKIIAVNGKYYAVINSLTNSTYTVVYNPVEFADVADHWAKAAVNDMGSRMIVSGIDSKNYDPDSDITRAQFAAIIVRTLGLQNGTGTTGFSDVRTSDWYAGAVKTAVEYGIISGYGNGTFGPNDRITREQAMAMISRAMKLTGLDTGLAAGEAATLLAAYTDGKTAADYAKTSIAECLKTGIVSGNGNGTLAPAAYITRAEVAVIAEKLLQKSNLI